MKNDRFYFILLILILTSALVGCGGQPPLTPTATATQKLAEPTVSPTPDVCSSGLVEEAVQKVHIHMREFDDASILASSMPRSQLSDSIADLQRIRREAEDETIPACLANLRKYQVEHMNSVINTLLAFMRTTDLQSLNCSGLENTADAQAICQNVLLARQQHDQYVVELARLLGITIVPATAPPVGPAPETPGP